MIKISTVKLHIDISSDNIACTYKLLNELPENILLENRILFESFGLICQKWMEYL